jgi:hypothetical protein
MGWNWTCNYKTVAELHLQGQNPKLARYGIEDGIKLGDDNKLWAQMADGRVRYTPGRLKVNTTLKAIKDRRYSSHLSVSAQIIFCRRQSWC